MLSEDAVERALVVMAHPDDVDFGCAGTISQWTAAGVDVCYCIVTDGDAGGYDPRISRTQMAELRREEQRAAAAELGVKDVTFLGYPDGRLTVGLELRRDISREIRLVRPQRLVCQSPERNYRRMPASHPDHMAAGEAALCAVYPDARNPFAHPELLAEEGLSAYAVPEVWIATGPSVGHYVDVTDSFDRKLAALRAHASQVSHVEDLEGMLRGWMGDNARAGGLPPGRLAESFQIVEIPV